MPRLQKGIEKEQEGGRMTWAQLSNVAVVAVLIILGSALTMVLTGLDRRLTEYRHSKARERFHSGAWR